MYVWVHIIFCFSPPIIYIIAVKKFTFTHFMNPTLHSYYFFKQSIIFSRYANNKKIMCMLTCVFTITSALFRSIFLLFDTIFSVPEGLPSTFLVVKVLWWYTLLLHVRKHLNFTYGHIHCFRILGYPFFLSVHYRFWVIVFLLQLLQMRYLLFFLSLFLCM